MESGTVTHGDRSRARSKATAGARPVGVGIVGAGKMGVAHAKAITGAGSLGRVVGFVDPEEARHSDFAATADDASAYMVLGDLLADERVDLVHICCPPAAHVPVAQSALEAGKHVYVEKPLAPSRLEAVELLATARERGLLVCPGHQLLRSPAVVRLLEVLPAVGTPVHVESYFSFNPVRQGRDGSPPLRDDLQLLDILPHPVYLLLRALSLSAPGTEIEVESLRLGGGGTVHVLLRAGKVSATLVATLRGRPVESYLKVVGDRGTVNADLVRGTVQTLLGPGTSGISKASNPYRMAAQIATGTTAALTRRILHRELSYPGLRELITDFHRAIQGRTDPPVSEDEMMGTVELCERVTEEIRAANDLVSPPSPSSTTRVVVTGGTGFLGRAVARELLNRGITPVAVARREPPPWEKVDGVQYREADLGERVRPGLFDGAVAVVHCAAATSGGFEVHERDSVGATENLLRAMDGAGVRRLVHVSSVAVLGRDPDTGGVSDRSSLVADPRDAGPYVWGKAESESRARRLSADLGIDLRILRPGPILDLDRLDPPGRLGRRVGDRLFVLVGSRSESIVTVAVTELATIIVTTVERFAEVPEAVNLVDQPLRTRGELVDRMRVANPDLRVLRLPRIFFMPLALLVNGALRALRAGAPDLRRAFASEAFAFERPALLRADGRDPTPNESDPLPLDTGAPSAASR